MEKLKSEGHELVKFEVPDVRQMIDIMYKVGNDSSEGELFDHFQNIFPDQGAYIKFIYANDLVDANLKRFVFLLNVSMIRFDFISAIYDVFKIIFGSEEKKSLKLMKKLSSMISSHFSLSYFYIFF